MALTIYPDKLLTGIGSSYTDVGIILTGKNCTVFQMKACGAYVNISVALTTNINNYTTNVYEFAIYGADSYAYQKSSAFVL